MSENAETPAPQRVRIPRTRRRADRSAIAYLVGFVVLAGTLVFLHQHPATSPPPAARPEQVDALEQEIVDLRATVTRLAARPAAPVTNLAPLEARVAALETRPAPPTPDLAPLAARVAALEARPAPRAPPPAASPAALDALGQRIAQLSNREQADLAAISARIDPLETRVAAMEKAGQGALAAEVARLGRLQAASAALTAGLPLGTIPGAPPALARFATVAPPTEAQLRLSFDGAAREARAASQPAVMAHASFLRRLWLRAQQAVTVREGTRVVLGDPVAGVLEAARRAVAASDWTGALRALDGLAGPAAAAMAPWRAEVQALLDARAALAGVPG